jgi:hypothetical protein
MSPLLPLALVLAAGGAVYLGVLVAQPFFGRRVCPTCGRRGVEPDPAGASELAEARRDLHVAVYRCRNCGVQWFSANGGGLITHEAFEVATRAPLPIAIVHPHAERGR